MLRSTLFKLSSLLCLLFATPVWANDLLIFHSNNESSQYSNLKSHYEGLGFTVTGSTSGTVSSSLLSGKEMVIDITGTSNCGSTCRTNYDSFVSGGGKLIIAAPMGATNRLSNIESLIENKMQVGSMTYFGSWYNTGWQSIARDDYATAYQTTLPGTDGLFTASGGTPMASNSYSSNYHTWYKWDYGSNGGTIIVTTGYGQFLSTHTYSSNMETFLTTVVEEEGLYSSSSSGSSATPVYSSGITAAQSTKRSTKLSETNAQGGMIANIDILGGSNIVDVYQADAEHYLELSIVGNTNAVDIDQTQPTGTAPHYADVVIDGNRNTLDLLQTGTGSKTAFVDVDGDDNVVDVIQKDSGQHYLQLDLIGDDHSATIVQEGSGSHDATVELTNGGGAWDFNLNQKGTTDKEYSLPHSMSDGSTTSGTCYVAAGCSATIIQSD